MHSVLINICNRPAHASGIVEASKRYADIIVPEGGLNAVALDMVIARLQFLLGEEALDD